MASAAAGTTSLGQTRALGLWRDHRGGLGGAGSGGTWRQAGAANPPGGRPLPRRRGLLGGTLLLRILASIFAAVAS